MSELNNVLEDIKDNDNYDNKIKLIMDSMKNIMTKIENDIIVGKKNIDTFNEFLDKVESFISWTNEKYNYSHLPIKERNVKRGEIYYCHLGKNIGSEQDNLRPVIILQNDTGNKFSLVTIVAPITSVEKKLPVHVDIKKVCPNIEVTGYIICEQIRAVSKVRLAALIDQINPASDNWDLIDNALRISLGIKEKTTSSNRFID